MQTHGTRWFLQWRKVQPRQSSYFLLQPASPSVAFGAAKCIQNANAFNSHMVFKFEPHLMIYAYIRIRIHTYTYMNIQVVADIYIYIYTHITHTPTALCIYIPTDYRWPKLTKKSQQWSRAAKKGRKGPKVAQIGAKMKKRRKFTNSGQKWAKRSDGDQQSCFQSANVEVNNSFWFPAFGVEGGKKLPKVIVGRGVRPPHHHTPGLRPMQPLGTSICDITN